MESFFLNLGLSYTWSKAFPYIIMIITGVALGIYLFKRVQSKVMKIISLLLIAAPFGIYFAFEPIYEGDFTNEFRTVEHSSETTELAGNKLVIISLPGCVFCKESIQRLKEVKKHHKNIQIEYVVTSSDSSTLDFYTEVLQGEFPIRLANDPEAMRKLAEGRFPSFVLVNENNPMKVWVNNTFGVMALDNVVKSFE